MILSRKALIEITKIEAAIGELNETIKNINHSISIIGGDVAGVYQVTKLLRKQVNKFQNQGWKKKEKVDRIRAEGISTSERAALLKEARSFHCLSRDKDISCTRYTVVGYSKIIGPCKVWYRVWSCMMSNVVGCRGLANKRELDSFELISIEDLSFYSQENGKATCNFCGATEIKTIPNVLF